MLVQNHLAQGNAALVDGDYAAALAQYAAAAQLDPRNAEVPYRASIAAERSGDSGAALGHAEAAGGLLDATTDPALAARVRFRRGTLLFAAGELARARADLAHISALAAVPPGVDQAAARQQLAECEAAIGKATAAASTPAAAAASAPSSSSTTSKLRHEFFQTDEFVTVSLFIKNADPSTVRVDISPRAVFVAVNLPPPSSTITFTLDPLAHAIDPKLSSFEVLRTKIEIKLRKAAAGFKWGKLEGDDDELGGGGMASASTASARPAYPSSSKKKINFDEIEKTIVDDKPEGEQALNALFQQIFKDGSDETRRAMMKSFVESNGTCLSTNWDEVGKGKVETKPPEGMVAKPYEK